MFYKKKLYLKIPQNSQESSCENYRHQPAILLKKRFWHRCFPVNFVKLLRTPFLENTFGRLHEANMYHFETISTMLTTISLI